MTHNVHKYKGILGKGKGRGRKSRVIVDNMDSLDAHFKSLAYNICGVNTTNIQPIKIKRFKTIHNIHKPDSIWLPALFSIVHNTIHNLPTRYPQIYFSISVALCNKFLYIINTGCNLTGKQSTKLNERQHKMTQSQFATLCAAQCIDPAIALENDNVIAAIRAGDIAALTAVLQNEF